MSDYTPRTLTTEEVRKAYTLDIIHTADGRVVGFETSPENLAEFDRWLAQHDKEVRAKRDQELVEAINELPRTQIGDYILGLLDVDEEALIKGEQSKEEKIADLMWLSEQQLIAENKREGENK